MASYGTVESFEKKRNLARNKREIMRPLLERCYQYISPLQERKQPSQKTQDERPDLSSLYDSTAPAAAQDLASEMLDDLWPMDSKPFTLELGRTGKALADIGMVKRVEKELAERSDIIIDEINNSGCGEGEGWYSAAHEALLDWAISQGTMARHVGKEPGVNIRFEALSLPTITTLRGPYGATETLFRESRLCRSDIVARWPNARKLAKSWTDSTMEAEEDVVEGIWRDRSKVDGVERWVTQVKVKSVDQFVFEQRDEGYGSKPFIDFTYMRAPGETLGRGPGMLCLSDTQVVNAVKEMHLDLLDLQLWGIWQLEDSSMNIENIPELSPRMVMPVEPGTKGLQRVDGSPNANAIEHVVGALQSNIRDVLYGLDLGPTDRTPRSASEVMARTSIKSKRRAGPYSRLLNGLLKPTVLATNWALEKRGILEPIKIDGRTVRIRPLAQITRSQQLDEVLRFDRFCEIIYSRFGPSGLIAVVGLDEAAPWLAGKVGVDPRMVRPSNDIKTFQQQAIAAAAAQGPGGPVSAPTVPRAA